MLASDYLGRDYQSLLCPLCRERLYPGFQSYVFVCRGEQHTNIHFGLSFNTSNKVIDIWFQWKETTSNASLLISMSNGIQLHFIGGRRLIATDIMSFPLRAYSIDELEKLALFS